MTLRRLPTLVALGALFCGLTAAGAYWALRSSQLRLGELAAVFRLAASSVGPLAGLTVAIYASDVLRYRLMGRALGIPIRWRVGLDASMANFLFSWITPGAAMGAPAAMYMLHRGGVPWPDGAVIAFGKSLTSGAVVVALSFLALAVGLAPDFDATTRAVLTSGAGVAALLLALPVLGALCPAHSLDLIDALERRLCRGTISRGGWAWLAGTLRTAVERLGRLTRGGASTPIALLAAHLAHFGSLVAVAVVLAVSLGATSSPQAVGASMLYTGVTYLAPTPGGAGIAEAVGGTLFAGVLAPREALLVAIAARLLTIHLQIVLGAVYLAIVGGTTEIMANRRRPRDRPASE